MSQQQSDCFSALYAPFCAPFCIEWKRCAVTLDVASSRFRSELQTGCGRCIVSRGCVNECEFTLERITRWCCWRMINSPCGLTVDSAPDVVYLGCKVSINNVDYKLTSGSSDMENLMKFVRSENLIPLFMLSRILTCLLCLFTWRISFYVKKMLCFFFVNSRSLHFYPT